MHVPALESGGRSAVYIIFLSSLACHVFVREGRSGRSSIVAVGPQYTLYIIYIYIYIWNIYIYIYIL